MLDANPFNILSKTMLKLTKDTIFALPKNRPSYSLFTLGSLIGPTFTCVISIQKYIINTSPARRPIDRLAITHKYWWCCVSGLTPTKSASCI